MSHARARIAVLIGLTLLLGACSSMDLLSFGGIKEQDTSRAPAGATAYRCADGKRLYVRYLDNGAAWVILPGREFRLDRAGAGARYSNGSDALDVAQDGATLTEDGKLAYAACKEDGGRTPGTPAAAPARAAQ